MIENDSISYPQLSYSEVFNIYRLPMQFAHQSVLFECISSNYQGGAEYFSKTGVSIPIPHSVLDQSYSPGDTLRHLRGYVKSYSYFTNDHSYRKPFLSSASL